jgi:hypothetical protein
MFAETAIVQCLLMFVDQGIQTCFSVFVCNKQRNGSLPFPFAGNKRKLPFLLVPFSVLQNSGLCMETWTYSTDMDMETLRHGDMDLETWRHGNMETWRHGDITRKMENGSPSNFP